MHIARNLGTYCKTNCKSLILLTFWGANDSPDPNGTLKELALMPKAKKKTAKKKTAKKAKKKK